MNKATKPFKYRKASHLDSIEELSDLHEKYLQSILNLYGSPSQKNKVMRIES
jgi:hypothetical protein